MKWKAPKSMQFTSALSIVMMLTGVFIDNHAAIAAGCVSLVVVSIGVEILEAIYKVGDKGK